MIFVTVGTSSFQFTRLIKGMDNIAQHLDEEVIMQIGYNSYSPKYSKSFSRLPEDQFDKLIDSARIIVSHAGVGSIIVAFNKKKPIIIVPRRKEYGEHFDNHQVELAKALEQQNILKVVWDPADLSEILKSTISFDMVKSEKKDLIENLKGYLSSLDAKKRD